MISEFYKGTAKELTKNFNSKEFDCKCKNADCKKTLIDLDGVNCLQKVRDTVGKAVKITSGFRCKSHNKSVGGVASSLHLKGSAFDVACPSGVTLNCFAFICEQAGFKGVLRYDGQNFVHCDMRSERFLGVTKDNGKTFKQVDTFNPCPSEKAEQVNLPILKIGSKGDSVKVLQKLLCDFGIKGKNGKDLTADGDFGSNTEFAVGKLQEKCDFKVDYTANAKVWQKLLGVERWN